MTVSHLVAPLGAVASVQAPDQCRDLLLPRPHFHHEGGAQNSAAQT